MEQFAFKKSKKSQYFIKYGYLLIAIISIFALLFTFVVAISDFRFITKVLAFALIVITTLFSYSVIRNLQNHKVFEMDGRKKVKDDKSDIFESDIDEKLTVLEEAGKFFGASLKTVDMFRLLSSRTNEIVPFTTSAFFLIDENNNFRVPFATGKNARLLESISIECDEGIAGKAFLSGDVERDKNLVFDKSKIEIEFLDGLKSAIAVPLVRNNEVFCVLVLYSEEKNKFSDNDELLLETIGERITPLIIGSISFEQSLSNALTDSITNLPNERAFYLFLENQVAESQRFLEQRALTVLAIDIKNFTEINEKYGHSTGDQVLAFSAEVLKKQLRKMDMLSRTSNDEFLIILPTANDIITSRIVERIESAFLNETFQITENERCMIELSFGSATFQDDGDTANQLLKTALLRKYQSKGNVENSVIFFPRQYLN